TTLKIYLPQSEAVAGTVEPRRKSDRPAHGTETILLVEDEAGIRKLSRQALEGSGYKVLEAHNGKHAIQVCEQHKEPIHLLVTDVAIPDTSATKAARQLSSSRPDMKVLFLSGYTDEEKEHLHTRTRGGQPAGSLGPAHLRHHNVGHQQVDRL